MAKRPNILLITSDQHRGDSYGFENPGIYTPPLDRLARNGTRFPACITPSPICQPARASILTGLLPLTHGVCDNGIDMPADIAEQGFAGQLTRGGYCTAMIGKADFATMHTFAPTGTPECKVRPTIRRTGMALTWAFSTPNWSWRATTTGCPPSPPHGQNYEHWYHGDGLGEEKNALSKEARPPLTDAVQTCNSALPVAWHNSTWVGDQTIRYLDGCADSDEPFCVWASFPSPPYPFDAPEP